MSGIGHFAKNTYKKSHIKKSCKKHPGYRGNDMETKRIVIKDRKNIKDEELAEAAAVLRSGGLVAFPTETVYGLGGNALDEDAARKIYAAKGRPSDNPLIAHISCAADLAPLVKEIPVAGRKLMEAFWPGPLTMIFPKSGRVPYGTGGERAARPERRAGT